MQNWSKGERSNLHGNQGLCQHGCGYLGHFGRGEPEALDTNGDGKNGYLALGFNKNKLTTHCVGIFAVGSDADYKAHVLAGKPEGKEAVKAYYEENRYLVDLSSVKEEEIGEMVYNTMNVINAGRILNTVMEDYDAMAEQAAAIMASLLKGKTVEKACVAVPYKPYA